MFPFLFLHLFFIWNSNLFSVEKMKKKKMNPKRRSISNRFQDCGCAVVTKVKVNLAICERYQKIRLAYKKIKDIY
jgi:hypothetical protein